MAARTMDDIQLLLDQPHGQGMVVSCYTDTSVAEGFESHWLQSLKTEASRVRQALGDDDQALQEFERDLKAIRGVLESPEARQSRGMAVFSAGPRKFLLAVPSDVPFENRLVLDERPYVVPLIEAKLRGRSYLVVMFDSHRGRLHAAGRDGLQLLDEFEESIPGKIRSSGERWGKQQATIDRHRKDLILHFHKDLAREIEKAWDEGSYQGIILLGDHRLLVEFRNLLPDRLSRRVVHEAPHAWTDGPVGIEETVRGVIAADQSCIEKRALDEFTRRLDEGCAVTAGPREVIEALRNGQVSELILGPDPGAIAYRCTGCRSVFADERSTCPYCSSTCRKGNLWQEVLEFAMSHAIRVDLVRAPENLERHGGIAALLRRDEPQWTQPSKSAEVKEMAP